MRAYMLADDVEFEETVNGWVMVVTSDDGDVFRFDIHPLAWDLVWDVDRTLGAWRREGEKARAEMREQS